ncbi:MAG: serine/threonine protein kinase, partial [Gemmataceae bacterium]|nr:serine/threonine protein kinase [Gemmataceae bacterium]
MICPTDDVLARLLAGEAADDTVAHVNACPECHSRLDRASDDPELGSWRGAFRSISASNHNRAAELARVIDVLASPHLTAGPDSPGPWPLLGPALRPGDLGSIGPYPVEAELGRGGMGIVFRAFDPALKRTVAIKVLRPAADDAATRVRLEREAQSLARLHHANIVGVHAVGETSAGLPYLVLEYVDGPSLAEHLRKHGPLAPADAAELIAAVADGLQAAHEAGLIHRDLKPANILLGDPSAESRKLWPRVVDFGLVRGAGATHTASGMLAGTPAYMSPEQIRDPAEIDALADVYSLGATLYECLTGDVPFRGSAAMVLRQVLDDEPRPPRLLNESVPRDLEVICLKAMAKNPASRYRSMAELAADLRRYLSHEPILARPAGRIERAWRWCRRNPRTATLTGLVATLLLVLAAGGTTAAVLISRAYGRAVVAQQQAETDFDIALHSLQTLAETVQKQMGTQPGLLPVKRKLLETA